MNGWKVVFYTALITFLLVVFLGELYSWAVGR